MTDSGETVSPGAIGAALKDAALAERSGQAYGAVGAVLKEVVATARRSILRRHARGDVIGAKLSVVMDECLSALLESALEQLPAKAKTAIAATGGYGRACLAPYSDIDLLILYAGVSEAALKPALDQLLYPLWDAGLVVGHAVHTPASAVKFARADMTAMTAYLDSRLIAGEAKLFKDFTTGLDLLRWRTKSKFVKAKRAEQEGRHLRSAQSRYLAEPDLKEGKGGLRDIHAIGWIYRALNGRPLDGKPKAASLFRAEEIASLRKAERFLLSLRAHLHDLRGRADEKLSFEIQPALAERLGYARRADMSAAERMMKHYFVTAMEIGRLTRIFWARIEEENAKLLERAPALLPKVLQRDEAAGRINLRIRNGRLDFARPAAAARDPVDLFRYFRAFAKKPEIDFHPDALALISKSIAAMTRDVRRDPVIASLFVASLESAKDPVKLLQVMSETGLLGRYIPSFGQITGRIEYGLYRRFTLDEHIFQSIGILARLRAGEMKDQHPVSTGILERRAEGRLFFLTVLLHEAGRSLKDRDAESAESLVERIARRLGAKDEEAASIAWCAAKPLLMVRIAERRNLGETRAIARFAAEVGTIDRLELLLVLTVCHLRAASENALDDWTRRQITSLYFGARAWLEGGEDGLTDWMRKRAKRARIEIENALADWPKDDRVRFLDRLSDESIALMAPFSFARAAELARGAEDAGVAATISGELVEAIVYAPDRPGLLADLAGAIAAAGGDVRNVHAMTLDDGRIIDAFTIRPPEGVDRDIAPDFVKGLHGELLAAARERPKSAPAIARRIGDRRSLFFVPPLVRIDSESSDASLIVETEGRDRPGLLHGLASALARLGVAIRSAHIATYGERAVDAFYLQDETGAKISDRRRIQSIEKHLLAALGDGAAAKPAMNAARTPLTPQS